MLMFITHLQIDKVTSKKAVADTAVVQDCVHSERNSSAAELKCLQQRVERLENTVHEFQKSFPTIG